MYSMRDREHFLAPPDSSNAAGQVIRRAVLCFFGVFNILIVAQFLMSQLGGWRPLTYLFMVLYPLTLCGGCFLLMRYGAGRKLAPVLVILVSLAVRLLYILLIPTQPMSDFEVLNWGAHHAMQGDAAWFDVSEGYMYNWPYQIPFIFYEAAVLKVFGAGATMAIKMTNLLFMVGANYLIYLIARRFLSEAAALGAGLVYALFPGVIIYSSVLTNQHISTFFLLLGIFFLLRSDRPRDMTAAGLSLAMSNLMRPEAIVVVTAVICCGLLRFIQRPSLRLLGRMALALAIMLVCYFALQKLVGLILVASGFAPNGIGNNIPEWKFIVGLGNVKGYGVYSDQYANLIDLSASERRAGLQAIIRELFDRPAGEVVDFFVGKVRVFWTDPQNMMWSTGMLDENSTVLPGLTVRYFCSGVQSFERGTLLFVYLLALPAPVLLWRSTRRETDKGSLLCIAVLCVMIIVYLLIEVQVRYRLLAIPFWILAGGVTLDRLSALPIFSRKRGNAAEADNSSAEKGE